jgi:hypothetical protein
MRAPEKEPTRAPALWLRLPAVDRGVELRLRSTAPLSSQGRGLFLCTGDGKSPSELIAPGGWWLPALASHTELNQTKPAGF